MKNTLNSSEFRGEKMLETIIGTILICLGLLSIGNGKIPFMKNYNDVKNIALHARIEGSAVLCCGILIIFSSFLKISTVGLIILALMITVVTITLEIVLKAI